MRSVTQGFANAEKGFASDDAESELQQASKLVKAGTTRAGTVRRKPVPFPKERFGELMYHTLPKGAPDDAKWQYSPGKIWKLTVESVVECYTRRPICNLFEAVVAVLRALTQYDCVGYMDRAIPSLLRFAYHKEQAGKEEIHSRQGGNSSL